ncbi:hypothetical protein BDZ91DRAFT_712023 [Kalaharituber pfeilii]|nr:hypothetical protein BDZ91DRAFT_712023 [Kalaharituber pfeilii]
MLIYGIPPPPIGHPRPFGALIEIIDIGTSLHHSTLAEKSSPDSSPQPGGGAGAGIGGGNQQQQQYANFHSGYNYNSAFPPSSSASVDGSTAGDNDTSTDEDDELDLDLMASSTTQTPISSLGSNSMFRQPNFMDISPSLMNSNHAVQAVALMRNPKSRHRLKPSRNSSSSASASNSSLASPSPTTPPTMGGPMGNGYFGRPSGRDSLSQAIRDTFTLSGGLAGSTKSDDDRKEEGPESNDPIKRVVTRRGNLLPKTKNFQRIKAALQEELSPLDIEVKREAEVTRQLREEDDSRTIKNSILPGQLLPIQQTLEPEELDDTTGEDESMGGGSEIGVSRKNSTGGASTTGIGIDMGPMGFNKRAQMFGTFNFDSSESVNGSPPRYPVQSSTRMNSDGDIVMQSDTGSNVSSPIAPVELRKMKRRRTQDERFEAPNSFKRRAVSPGVCGSPILTGSPSAGPVGGNGGKRLNFGQGISDTHDGMMKMSIQ